jgi:XRE family transcriptional regulator, thiamine biosynthesis regulator
MVQVFLPAMRQLVARNLRSQGLSQNRISSMLGVTQASVSLYLSSRPEKAYADLSSLSVQREEADRNANVLAEDVKRSAVYGVETLGSLWRGMLGRGSVCESHRKLYPSLSTCDVCIKEYGEREGDVTGAIDEVSSAIGLLESSRAFVSVMPEVSVNIAYAPPGSLSPEDVVAVPGRIVKVKGRAKATLPPEFGASRHIAKVLLLVVNRRPGTRSCINLRYDPMMRKVLHRLGIRTLEISEYPQASSEDRTVSALTSRLASTRAEFDAVVDSGGKGVEPNLYLFGKDAREVASLAIKIARLYSAE